MPPGTGPQAPGWAERSHCPGLAALTFPMAPPNVSSHSQTGRVEGCLSVRSFPGDGCREPQGTGHRDQPAVLSCLYLSQAWGGGPAALTLHNVSSSVTILPLEGPQTSWKMSALDSVPLPSCHLPRPCFGLPTPLPRWQTLPVARSPQRTWVVFTSSGPHHDRHWAQGSARRERRARPSFFEDPGHRQVDRMWEVPAGVQASPGHCCPSLSLFSERQALEHKAPVQAQTCLAALGIASTLSSAPPAQRRG